jgi:Tfp pilus assembly protein PilV
MSPRAGFTLIDTLIALLVLEVALLGLAGTLSSGERLLARGRLATRAAAQGRDLLARVARRDSVCAALSGVRVFPGARVTWAPDASPTLRRVIVLIDRPSPVAVESIATVVRCA